jgi:hypothetical protein
MNPLIYKLGTKFSGKILNDWLSEQITNHGSHEKIAQKIDKHFILKNDRTYQLVQMSYRDCEEKSLGFMEIKT